MKFVEFSKTIVDTLHTCLRITDRLFEILISYIDEKELKDKKDQFDLSKRTILKRLLDFLENDCRVSSPLKLEKNDEDSKITIRSLNQKERLRILKKIQQKNLMEILLISDSKVKLINFVLTQFYILFLRSKKDYSVRIFDKEKYIQELKHWLIEGYLKIIGGKENITPYIHIFVFHFPEFIEKYRNLNKFNCQSLEKLNSLRKTHYFRQTNRQIKKSSFLTQLLEKSNRMEFINLKGEINELYQKVEKKDIQYSYNGPIIESPIISQSTDIFCDCEGKCSSIKCPCVKSLKKCNIDCHNGRISINCINY